MSERDLRNGRMEQWKAMEYGSRYIYIYTYILFDFHLNIEYATASEDEEEDVSNYKMNLRKDRIR